MSDDRLRDIASCKAARVQEIYEHTLSAEQAYRFTQRLVLRNYGLQPVAVTPEKSHQDAVIDMTESHWWRRQLRKKRSQILLELERALGFLNKHNESYCGETTLKLHQHAVDRQKEYQERTEFRSPDGQQTLWLKEVAEHNISNPRVRNAEMMTRIKGCEQVSQIYGHKALFITLTCPSRFHRTRASGQPNPRYDGSTIQDAQKHLQQAWSRCRADYGRQGIRPYGFRVVEPHHDGTPHWHMLLFVNPENSHDLQKSFRRHFITGEVGTQKHAVKVVEIDPNKGSAAGYIAKYVSKSLDGKHIDKDLYGNEGSQAAERITAWARATGIRQFQAIGGPSVTLWRELRRLREPVPDDAVERARGAADAGDWAAFVIAMGGIDKASRDRPVALHHEYHEFIDYQTGEVLLDDTKANGKPKPMPVRGVRSAGAVFITRAVRWVMTQSTSLADSASPLAGLNRRVAGAQRLHLGPV